MYQSVNETAFIEAFRAFGRVNNFEVDGLRALYEYLTDLERDIGEQHELDVIALCCDFDRWESLEDYHNNYGDDEGADSADELDAFACWVDGGPAFITHAH